MHFLKRPNSFRPGKGNDKHSGAQPERNPTLQMIVSPAARHSRGSLASASRATAVGQIGIHRRVDRRVQDGYDLSDPPMCGVSRRRLPPTGQHPTRPRKSLPRHVVNQIADEITTAIPEGRPADPTMLDRILAVESVRPPRPK